MWYCLRDVNLDMPGQVLDIVKSLTTELRLPSLNNILTPVVGEIYILLEKEDWMLDMSDVYGSITNLSKTNKEYFVRYKIYLSPI